MKEKRKYIRVAPSKPVKVKFRIVSGKQRKIVVLKRGKAYPKNISGGGMFLELPFMQPDILHDLLSGRHKMLVELKIPGYASKIRVLCKAVWLDKREAQNDKTHGIGIQFEDIHEEDKEHLLLYLIDLLLQ